MNLLKTLRVALRAIIRNKMRSFLTTLGIVIGVAAVIAMMAIGAGAKARVTAAFAAMGTDLLIVLPGSTTSGGVQGGFGFGLLSIVEGELRGIPSKSKLVPLARYHTKESYWLQHPISINQHNIKLTNAVG